MTSTKYKSPLLSLELDLVLEGREEYSILKKESLVHLSEDQLDTVEYVTHGTQSNFEGKWVTLVRQFSGCAKGPQVGGETIDT